MKKWSVNIYHVGYRHRVEFRDGWKTKLFHPNPSKVASIEIQRTDTTCACNADSSTTDRFCRVPPPLSVLLSIIFNDKPLYLCYTYFVNCYSSINSININHRWLHENLRLEQIFFYKFFQLKKKKKIKEKLHKYNVSFNLFVHIFLINSSRDS